MVTLDEDAYLEHYGILRRSGRYPWGSGGNQSTRNKAFLDYIQEMKAQGMTETEIARGVGISTTALRAARTIAKNEQRQQKINMAQRLKDKGMGNVAIGERMGINESSVRALLEPGAKHKANVLDATVANLKAQVADKTYLDVGSGNEHHLDISSGKLNTAIAVMVEEGYKVHYVKVPQLGTGKETTVKVLTAPNTSYSEVYANRGDIKPPFDTYTDDGGLSWKTAGDPLMFDSKRLAVRYAEDGGDQADGVIYVRPGVKDIDLGGKRYAQVRIGVDDTHFIKGMAVYKDDLPDGVDLMFNTNKSDTGNKLDALKELKADSDLPFGAIVRPAKVETGPDGPRTTSVMNLVNEEGDWNDWSRNLPSQMLSKQSPVLAKQQLAVTYERRKKELDEIMALTNPTVRRKLLETYADGTDSAAVHLKAAALPRQRTQVLLPVNSISETEIYAPNFRDGEQVVLVRFPHGGKFEIPELTVNNRHPEGRRLLGDGEDAVGINHRVAQRLSGADFDGDTVLVIPNNNKKISVARALEGLKDFDPVKSFPAYEGMKPISSQTKQTQMGVVSNLITDMTIKGASANELARAVRHSMVVIDAEKHNLDYRSSAVTNGIQQLKEKYQGVEKAGASTLISRATSEVRVPDRRLRRAGEGGPIDPKTGRKVYVETGESYVDRKGNTVLRTQSSQRLAEVDNAHDLSSGTRMEHVYAEHSNKLKGLANRARVEVINTPRLKASPSAKKVYAKEGASLNASLALAERNRPLERQAQILANAVVRAKRQANPEMEPATLKKVKAQALETARLRVGAGKEKIKITPSEWDAIQAGAVSESKLTAILNNADLDVVRKLATPRAEILMTPAKSARAQSMLKLGYTRAQVADQLGVSVTTLDRATTEEGG